jgi:hypothetical protein
VLVDEDPGERRGEGGRRRRGHAARSAQKQGAILGGVAIAAGVRSSVVEGGGALRGVEGPRLRGGGGGTAMAEVQSVCTGRFTGLGEKKHLIPCRRG